MGILGNADVSGIVAIIASGRLSNSKSGTVIAGSVSYTHLTLPTSDLV